MSGLFLMRISILNAQEIWQRDRKKSAWNPVLFKFHQITNLSPIENLWQPVEFHYNSERHWDQNWAEQRILDALERRIKQEWVNEVILSTRQRLQDCLTRNGDLTGKVLFCLLPGLVALT